MDTCLVGQVVTELSEMIKKINEVHSYILDSGCVDGTIIGTGRSDYTKESSMYSLSIKNKDFALIDLPGIEGDESAFENIIKRSLEQSHIIFYVNGSGKKIEKESLQKIKKYMHDGTSVYAIFNTHCKAKKERIPGIDLEYSEELKEAYNKQKEIVKQTEKELIKFLGKNYKGCISLNGLLGFCSLAFTEGSKTSIKREEDKNLRRDQIKYLKEYCGDKTRMFEDSHITLLMETLENRIESFDSEIVEENLKKLKNRMKEMLSKITVLKTREIKKIDGFISAYKDFEANCYNAKEDYIRTMRHVAYNASTDAFYDLMNELFDRIEQYGGSITSREVQKIVEMRRDAVVASIQQGVNSKIKKAQDVFMTSIKDAEDRMEKDFEREQIQFEINLSADSVNLDTAFSNALKYNLKDLGKHAFTVGSLAYSGATIGSLICPGLGTAIGAGVGTVLGVLSSIINYYISEKGRINNAKSKIRQAIDEQVDEISKQINVELKALLYEQKINEVYDSLYKWAEIQKKKMIEIKHLIRNVENEMLEICREIA